MPSVTLPRPRIVNPRNSYVDYYYRNLQNSYGYDNDNSHKGGGYSYGIGQSYGKSYGGDQSYRISYGGDQSYGKSYGNGHSYGNTYDGGQSYGYSYGNGQSKGNSFSYGGSSSNNYNAYSSGGKHNYYGHGPQSYSYGSQRNSYRGGVRTVFAPQLSGMMKHMHMSDMIGKEFDVRDNQDIQDEATDTAIIIEISNTETTIKRNTMTT
ncbi:unnamed protein product [Mytilus coruscus]|uniref:Uncharacterized protein n=1 Tax=Mytilus coruscus TaxID=42192 RepID=A0A6J8DQR4_MYTCO|nr:unnamed protein product [Mytilus coruscus]